MRSLLICSVLIAASVLACRDATAVIEPGSHTLATPNVRLHFVVRGRGAPLIVAAPGWGSGSLYLQHGLHRLEHRFTVIYVDMRGSGGSSRPIDALRMAHADMADDLEALRKELGLTTLNLLGHSDGGTIALEYAERYPHRVNKLVLVDSAMLGDRAGEETERFLTLWHDDPRYRAAVEQAQRDLTTTHKSDEAFRHDLGIELPMYFGAPEHDMASFLPSFRDTQFSSWAERSQAAAEEVAKRDQTIEYKNVTARTLLINGTADWVCPYQAAERASKAIRGAKLSLYANKGHIPWIESPDRFFQEVSLFLMQPD